MKKLFLCMGLGSLMWLIYALFQPIIEWNFGWNPIPKDFHEVYFTGIEREPYKPAIEKGKAIIDSLHKVSNAPSISIATLIDGKIVWSYAVGLQNIASNIPADTNTQYRIGSVSKALTSLGLARLIAQGKVHLDSSVQHYTGMFKEHPSISLRQLASHQSGIRNYQTCFCTPIWEYYRNKKYENVEASLSQFKDDPLLFPPNDAFSYSSYNYNALSLAMENASEQSFTDLMSAVVFNPLQMNHTTVDLTGDQNSHRSIPYETQKGYYKRSFDVNLSNKWAGGGFLSTPSDLVKAGNSLLDSAFLDNNTLEIITTPQVLNDGSTNEQNYAIGWRNDLSKKYFDGKKEVRVIHHGGMAVGGLALLLVYPEYNMVMAIAMNKSGEAGRFELFDYLNPIAQLFLSDIENR